MMFAPQSAIFLLAVAGVVTWLLGARRLGWTLAAPAVWRWLLWPLTQPLLAEVPVGIWLLLAIAGLPLLPFAAVWMLQRWFVNPAFGERTGAHVGATYLVRIIDAYLATILSVISWPFRRLRKPSAQKRRP
jgi:hypothetical protein